MNYTSKKLEKSQYELVITVNPADYAHALEHAAEHISARAAIKGFRPGKAPYDIVKQQVGEIKIMEEALEHIVQENFYEAVQKEKLETIGMPQITIEKMAPGNDIIFKAVAAILPAVKLADTAKIKVEQKKPTIEKKQVDEVVENLQKMQAKEVVKSGKSTNKDKVVVDLEMFIDKVPMEGGQAKDHQVYLSEDHYIPGFAEKLVGLEKDQTHEFSIKFPKEHYQKQFAGKNVDMKVKVKEVYELQQPELNEEFAKKLGQESMTKLRELLENNLLQEAEHKESQRIEVEILDKMIENSQFEEIPDILINGEKKKMFYELKHNLDTQGIEMEQYLKDLKKTEEQIFTDFTEQAVKRAKAALISRQIAIDNKIDVSKEEMDKEIEIIRSMYKGEKNVEENLKRPEVLETIATTLQNRKVLQWLKDTIIEKKETKTVNK